MKSLRPAVLLILVAACSDATTPSTPPQVTLTANTVWSGGQVVVRSQAFATLSALPVITIGGTMVPVKRMNDSTLAATAPIATGSLPVTVQFATTNVSAGAVTLMGFAGEVTGPYMSGRAAQVNPGSGSSPIVFASGDSGGVLVDLVANTVVGTVPDSVTSPDCAMSPGASYRGAGFFTLQGRKGGTCQYAMSWRVYPSLVIADSSSPISNGLQWYVMAEVGPKHWFENNNNHTDAYDCSGASCSVKSWIEGSGPNGVMIDSTDQRFTWTGQDLHGAVLSAASFDTVLALPPNTSMHGSAFSSGGDTLFFHGGLAVSPYTEFIGAVRSSDGAVVRNLNADSLGFGHASSAYGDVAVDPVNPWLYVLVSFGAPTNNYGLVVLDRGTWTTVGVAVLGTLSPEASDDLAFTCASIIPDPAHHRVYVVATAYGYNIHQHHGEILAFDTP